MASKEKLTIHKLVMNIQVADKDAYMHYADRFSKLCNRILPDKLDKILEKHRIPNGRLIIKKLNIDLGKIPPHSFEKLISESIAHELDNYLQKSIDHIIDQIRSAKFSTSAGGRILVTNSTFDFESEIYLDRSVILSREMQESSVLDKSYILKILEKASPEPKYKSKVTIAGVSAMEPTSLIEAINKAGKKNSLKLNIEDETVEIVASSTTPQIRLTEPVIATSSREILKAIKQDNEKKIVELLQTEIQPEAKLKAIQFLKEIPSNLPPKTLSELEKVFLYHIRYGRLPSNIKYELGMQMKDILNLNQLDVRFFNDLKKHVERDERAKERLIRLSDASNNTSFIKKEIIKIRELEQYNPRVPKSFEDYFTALLLDRDLATFSAELKRYNLNDMIRFFYADHPQKLRAIIQFLLVDYPSPDSTEVRLEKFFNRIGKSSIVKIIGSFVRKAGYVNKALNNLNKENERGIKDAHEAVLLAFLLGKNPIQKLKDAGFKVGDELMNDKDEKLDIMPRIFLSNEPTYKIEKYENNNLVDYFFRYGTLPHSSATSVISLEKLAISILALSSFELKKIPYFRDRMFEQSLKYSSIGQIDLKALEHILHSLVPNESKDLISKYNYFRINIKSGVPETFQKSFLIYYALKSSTKSYLEEMVGYWKKEFGDADEIIKRRWNVTEDIETELSKLLYIKKQTLAEQIKVDPEFENYSKDISIKNAGLVIVWPFLKVYFNMLDLLNEKGDFRSRAERARACHLLQYLAVKQSGGEEFYYPLNKILTGYPLDEPLPYEITMTQKEIDVSNALLKNIIKQWNALKGSSVDALRGSFLIRDGILVPAPNGWLLTIEKKAYDILLDKLPWGIGMIKLSWAPYVLSVEWDRNIM